MDLARVLVPILRHRVKLPFDWERDYKELGRASPRGQFAIEGDMLAVLLADFALSAAPSDRRVFGEYHALLRAALEAQLGQAAGRR